MGEILIQSYVGAYWGPRAQSVDECAKFVADLIGKMAGIDPLLAGWRSGANSRSNAIDQTVVSVDHVDIVERLLSGRNRTDTDGAVIEDLGFSVVWWNGSKEKETSIGLSIHVGVTSPWTLNSVVVRLPGPAAAPNLYMRENAYKILTTIIDIFNPEHAVWTNHSLTKLQSAPDRVTDDGGFVLGELSGHPAGWATYIADCETNHLEPQQLPISARIERVAQGTLVILGDDPANPPVKEVLQVRAAMGYQVARPEQTAQSSNASAGQPAPTPRADSMAGQDDQVSPLAPPQRGTGHERA